MEPEANQTPSSPGDHDSAEDSGPEPTTWYYAMDHAMGEDDDGEDDPDYRDAPVEDDDDEDFHGPYGPEQTPTARLTNPPCRRRCRLPSRLWRR